MELEPRQERFCQLYVVLNDATKAAIEAGYSEKTARSIGSENLTKPDIKARMAELHSAIANKLNIRGEDVISELDKLAKSNIQDYIKEGFEIEDIIKLERDKAAAIKSVQVTTTTRGSGENERTDRTVKFELHDKVKSLDLLGKVTGIYEKDNFQRKPPASIDLTNLSYEQLLAISKGITAAGTESGKD